MPWRYYDDEDLQAVKAVLDSGNLCSIGGTVTPEFERRFAAEFGAPYALAGNSAMSLMHAAVAAAGVEPGDEVIVDPLVTFAALSVMYHNGIPVYCDVDRETHNMDPALLEDLITERTRAIWVTHLWGLPADMDAINAVAQRHGLVVLEDCAHAIYAQYRGRYAGTLGDIATFSFQQSKQMGLGDAGMALMKSAEHHQVMAEMGTFGAIPPRLSWNYRLNEVIAAIGIVQLQRARGYVEQCMTNGELFSAAVADCAWVVPQRVPPDHRHAYHLWAALFEGDRAGVDYAAFQQRCGELGVGVGFGYIGRPAYLHETLRRPLAYGKGCPVRCPHRSRDVEYREGLCPVAEEIMPRLMLLYTGMGTEAARATADQLAEAVSQPA